MTPLWTRPGHPRYTRPLLSGVEDQRRPSEGPAWRAHQALQGRTNPRPVSPPAAAPSRAVLRELQLAEWPRVAATDEEFGIIADCVRGAARLGLRAPQIRWWLTEATHSEYRGLTFYTRPPITIVVFGPLAPLEFRAVIYHELHHASEAARGVVYDAAAETRARAFEARALFADGFWNVP